MKMKVFTIESGDVTEGARVGSFTLKGVGITIPAIIIGEEGRGRKLGVLPVQLLPEQNKEWEEKGYTHIHSATIGTTKAGKPKLFQTENTDTTEKCICVFRTKIGFRGGNSHTGDRVAEFWTLSPYYEKEAHEAGVPIKDRYTADEVREYSRLIMQVVEQARGYSIGVPRWDAGFDYRIEFAPFPGEILVHGVIAQGGAGRMGSGDQYVAVIPKGVVFRTGYSGRLYGAPPAHYYLWDGQRLLAATWEERQLADLF